MFVYNVHTTVLHHSNIQCYMSLTFTAVQLCELSLLRNHMTHNTTAQVAFNCNYI